MSRKNSFIGPALLLITALIWGISFVSQSVGMEVVECFTFSGIRTLLGGICLLPVVLILNKGKLDLKSVKCGAILAIPFFLATNFQQYAFNYSSAGKIAFITATYIFFVPLLGIFLKKKSPFFVWICVVAGFIGLYFLSIPEEGFGSINFGDILTFICAIFFTFQILLVEKYSDMDGVTLSCTQFIVSGLAGCILMFIFEKPEINNIKMAAIPILYSGIMSCGFGYTLQIIGQKYTESTIASLIMCMESVFGVITSAIILNEKLTTREIIGCSIMFAAIVFSQIGDKIFKPKSLQ